MIRSLIALTLFIATVPAHAQMVFRASSIDIEQDARLDAVESKVDRIGESLQSIERLLSDQAMERVIAAAPKPAATIQVSRTVQPASNRYTQAELTSIVQSRYPNGFRVRHADVSPRSLVWSHLKSGAHGFSASQVDGMSQTIALGLHDMEHGGEISPFRRQSRVGVTTSARPALPASKSLDVGCANGQCAKQSTAGSVQRVRLASPFRRLFAR